ncbi:glycosyltransferase family 1 protein [Acinetobacter qingfengensis]|uniref:Glycosyl transferase n=1 Tax=Acinetobacter qingfengensis TaxID=1262585 RepID=A0A1E7R1E6_9GAMM|nr:glycosyltransferase family 1 protein [Acinetobacter qingfengensis]KAA8733253.1 glycosyltransferase family 1 protein [Acinetobacter qingfengensis]OEY93114.1 glycosyl transferase [Acinetobacter qingfengensis]
MTQQLPQSIFTQVKGYFLQLANYTSIDHQVHTISDTLNIAIVTETWPPEINGVALSILQLAKGLQQRGHRILLVRPEQNVKTSGFEPEQECLVRAQSIPKYQQLNFGWPQVIKIGQAFDQFQPDIVHIVTEGPLGLAAMNQAKLRQLPISSGFHSSFHDFSRYFDLAFLIRPLRQYLKWFHNNTQLTCVPSQDTADTLRDFGIHCPLKVISRGVDAQHFHPKFRSQELRQSWQADEDTTVILCVGRISPEKELPVIFSAYQQILQQQSLRKYKLVIVGDGPNLAEYKAEYPEVIFMGLQVGDGLSECYASSDVFVFPSQVETFGNVVLEAMASALPVLAFNYACASQMLEHGQNGWLVPLGNVKQWQQQMLQLPDLYELHHMGDQAMQQVADRGWDKPVTDFENALKQYAKPSIWLA